VDSLSTNGPNAERTFAHRLCLGGLILAVALLLGGLIWGRVAANSPHLLWSAEQAVEYEAANNAVQAAHSHHGQPTEDDHAGEDSPDLAAAEQKLDALKAQLERAQYAQNGLGPLLTRIGLAGAIAFGIGYLVSRS